MDKNSGSPTSNDRFLFNDLRAINRDSIQLDLIQRRVRQFALQSGRRPRILVGQSGPGVKRQSINRRGAILAQWGFDADIGPLRQSPLQIAQMALENDVHMIILLCPQDTVTSSVTDLVHALEVLEAQDVRVAVFGHQPPDADAVNTPERYGFPAPTPFAPKSAEDVILLLDSLTRKK